jgi:hypothetical protein
VNATSGFQMTMFPHKIFAWLGVLALWGAGNVAAAAGLDHPDPMKVRAMLEHSSATSSKAKTSTTKVSALQEFILRGTGTQNASVGDGTCSGATCNASNGDCECLQFQGSLNASQLGNATWTAGITVNVDDCIDTGTPGPDASNPAFCCFGDGVLDATTTGNSSSTLELSFTGPVCTDPNANDDLSVLGGYIIVTADSSGKYAHSAGTGEVNFFVADDLTTYLAGSGSFQLTSPF